MHIREIFYDYVVAFSDHYFVTLHHERKGHMLKKILWIVAALYPVSVVFIIIANAGSDATVLSMIPGFLVFLVPLGVLIFELRDGKTPKIWAKLILIIIYLVSFVLLGVGTAGYYSFNTPTPFNFVKGLPLLITLLALFYFGFNRVFRKRAMA